ncbi:MAG: dethiobiotin synthase [Thermoproteota archaeon]|nr:dethiobiotin synthase [Thermoproteota archaeon]
MKRKGFFVAGTDTSVGKTTIAAAIALSLKKKGINVGIMKPFAAASKKYSSNFNSEDVSKLTLAAEISEKQEAINPYFSSLPTAPYTASRLKKSNRVDFSGAVRCYSALASIHDIMVVEGLGGILVPLTRKKTLADFAAATNLPIVIVARFGLGMINHTLLTLASCYDYNLNVEGIILNDLSSWVGPVKKKAIVKTIERVSGVKVLAVVPFIKNPAPDVVAYKLKNFPFLYKKL